MQNEVDFARTYTISDQCHLFQTQHLVAADVKTGHSLCETTCLCCSFQDTVIDGKAVTTSMKQRDVNVALSGLLGTEVVNSSEDTALPGATDDLCTLTTELDACIALQGLRFAYTDM